MRWPSFCWSFLPLAVVVEVADYRFHPDWLPALVRLHFGHLIKRSLSSDTLNPSHSTDPPSFAFLQAPLYRMIIIIIILGIVLTCSHCLSQALGYVPRLVCILCWYLRKSKRREITCLHWYWVKLDKTPPAAINTHVIDCQWQHLFSEFVWWEFRRHNISQVKQASRRLQMVNSVQTLWTA